MSQGWIKLHRSIEEDDEYFIEPFTRMSAWIDLLLLANHKKRILYIRGNKVVIERGQVGWSEVALAKRWKWSRNKVRGYLKSRKGLKRVQQKGRVLGLITIINYEKHQTKVQQKVQQKDIRKYNRRYPNKNDKNEKNDNNNGEDEKKLGKWLGTFEDVESPNRLAAWYFKKFPAAVIKKAMENSTCTSVPKFSALLEFYSKPKDDQVDH